jgi:hypothetical protein
MRLNTGELVELAGVKNSNDYWGHSQSLDSASRVASMGLRLNDVVSFVFYDECGLEWLFFIVFGWFIVSVCSMGSSA